MGSSRTTHWTKSYRPSTRFCPITKRTAVRPVPWPKNTSEPKAFWRRFWRIWDFNELAANRYLIVNADDFVQSEGINRGIIDAFENGIVTSVSLMARWRAAASAAAYARAHPNLSVGLHVDLGEWVYREGEWQLLYEVVETN